MKQSLWCENLNSNGSLGTDSSSLLPQHMQLSPLAQTPGSWGTCLLMSLQDGRSYHYIYAVNNLIYHSTLNKILEWNETSQVHHLCFEY